MSLTYPRPLTPPYGAFLSADPPVVVKPDVSDDDGDDKRPSLKITFSSSDAQPLPIAEQPRLIGVTRVVLFADGSTDAEKTSTSFNNGDQSDKTKAIKPFCYCPEIDAVRVGWKMRNEQAIAKATIEIHAARLDGPISKKEISGAALTKDPKAQGTEAPVRCTGSILLKDAIQWAGTHDALFPDQVLTAEHSPYQVRIIVEKKPEGQLGAADKKRALYPSVAWTFFNVLVDHLELEWGDQNKIPAGGPPGVDAVFKNETIQLETALSNALTGTPLQTIDLAAYVRQLRAGNRPAVNKIEVPLLIHQYEANQTEAGEPAIKSNQEAIVKVWGDGPRLPLRAKAFIRRVDGSAASFDQSKKVLGKVKFLWDWSDDPGRWKDWIVPGPLGHSLLSQEMLGRAFAKREPDEPRGSVNCPKTFGGRRGDATKPIFPAQASGTFGYAVVDGSGTPRTWSSVSDAGTGANIGMTEALFHPSPFPGDQYRVHVYVTGADDASAGGRTGQDDKPDLRIADPGKALHEEVVDTAQPPAHAPRVPVFEIYRKAKLKILNAGTPMPGASLNAAAVRYKRELNVILEHQAAALPGTWLSSGTNLQNVWGKHSAKIDTLATRLVLETPQPANFGTHLLHTRAYAAFVRDLPSFIATAGRLFRFTRPGGKLERHVDAGIPFSVGAGLTANAKEYVLDGWKFGKKGDAWQWVLLVENGGSVPSNGTVIENQAVSDVTELIAADLEVARVNPAGALAANDIKVRFVQTAGPTEITLTYGKKGVRGRIQRSVPSAGAKLLKQTFDNFVANPSSVVRNPKFRVEMVAPDPGTDARATERLRRLQREIEKRFAAAGCFVSPTRFSGAATAVYAGRVYERSLNQLIKSARLSAIEEIAKANAGETGAICLYLDQFSDVDLTATGGAFKSVGSQRRGWLFVVRGATVVSRQAQYDTEEIFSHELLHMLWRGEHAERGIIGFMNAGVGEKSHVPYDGCLMNYDAEPTTSYFCAECMLNVRGWALDPATRMKKDGAQLAHVLTLIDQEIADPAADNRTRAWKLLRKAFLKWKANAQADAESAALDALAKWEKVPGLDWQGPERVSLLRAVIMTLTNAGKPERTLDLRRKMDQLSDYPDDFKDFPDAPTDEPLKEVQILDGANGPATESVTQYVNLSRLDKFADGTTVSSIDRLGPKVRVKLVFAEKGKHKYTVQLFGHLENLDYSDEERETPALNWQGTPVAVTTSRPDYNLSYGAALTGKTDPDGTKVLEIELPPTGGNSYIVVADAGSGRTLESYPIDVERLLFLQRVVCTNAAADVAAGNAFTDKLNEAFVPNGIRFLHAGDSPLNGHTYMDSRDVEVDAFLRDAAALASGASTFNGQTFAALRPHLVQVMFAKQVLGEAGHARMVQDGVSGGGTVTLTVKDNKQALCTLWLGEPAGHEATVVTPQHRNNYLGDGQPKRWLLWGNFAGQDIQLGDVDGVQDDAANAPQKCTKIDVNLSRFLATLTGKLAVTVLTTRWVGGVSLKSDWQIGIASRGPFAAAGDPLDKQVAKVVHEIGHLIGMVPRYFYDGDADDTRRLPAGPTGLDGPSTWYALDGDHCSQGLSPAVEVRDYRDHKDRNVCRANGCTDIPECVMFSIIGEAPMTTFCTHCAPCVRKLALQPIDNQSAVWKSVGK